jgi:2-haloacid dehalogenase
MLTSRRDLLTLVSGAAVAGLAAPLLGTELAPARRFSAVAFDAFPILDPRPVAVLAEEVAPGRGAELMTAWRTRQFEYTWLRTLSGTYCDFLSVTEDALVFAARSLRLDLAADARDRLVKAHLTLKAWPDAREALTALRAAGVRMAFLSNFTAAMLDAGVRNSGLEGFFGPHLTTDRVRAFKPDPRAYRMATDGFGLPAPEILFAAFAGWDAAGAKAYGLPTFWVNRLSAPAEELGVRADASGSGLAELVRYVLA